MAEHVRVLLTEEDVDRRIQEIGDQISRDYEGRQVHLICVLKGGSFFMCELAKRITVPVSLDFMSVSSYGSATKSSGVVRIVKDLDEPLKDKDVLVVEDIMDTGLTLKFLLDFMKAKCKARDVKLACLCDKKCARKYDITPDFYAMDVDDKFIVGFGLDYNELYRNLPYIGYFE